MSHGLKQHVVHDGQRRASRASIGPVRAEVQREFLGTLAKAGFLKRIFLRIQMKREVKRRMRALAPPWALYGRSGCVREE